MRDLAIDRAEVFVVGPPTERYTWAEGMTDQYMANTILRLTTRGRAGGRRRRRHVQLARVRPLGRRDAALPPARRDRPLGAGARGALVPPAHARHAAGPAGAVADRHRALGHRRQGGRPAALPDARRRAREDPVLCQHAAARRRPRPMSTTSPSGARRATTRSSSIAGATPRATCRWSRRCRAAFAPAAASRSCSTSSSATTAHQAPGRRPPSRAARP